MRKPKHPCPFCRAEMPVVEHDPKLGAIRRCVNPKCHSGRELNAALGKGKP